MKDDPRSGRPSTSTDPDHDGCAKSLIMEIRWIKPDGCLFASIPLYSLSSTSCDLMACLVSVNDTWLYQWDPETKQQSIQWRPKESTPPRMFITQKALIKRIATVLDFQG
ncbi:hypothetical protein J6590_039596, partial [Homalodisca vitripennis]